MREAEEKIKTEKMKDVTKKIKEAGGLKKQIER